MNRTRKSLYALTIGLLQLVLAAPAWAQTYGQAGYNTQTYGGATSTPAAIQIGPLTLPVTGASMLALGSAVLISIGVALFIRQRHKHQPNS